MPTDHLEIVAGSAPAVNDAARPPQRMAQPPWYKVIFLAMKGLYNNNTTIRDFFVDAQRDFVNTKPVRDITFLYELQEALELIIAHSTVFNAENPISLPPSDITCINAIYSAFVNQLKEVSWQKHQQPGEWNIVKCLQWDKFPQYLLWYSLIFRMFALVPEDRRHECLGEDANTIPTVIKSITWDNFVKQFYNRQALVDLVVNQVPLWRIPEAEDEDVIVDDVEPDFNFSGCDTQETMQTILRLGQFSANREEFARACKKLGVLSDWSNSILGDEFDVEQAMPYLMAQVSMTERMQELRRLFIEASVHMPHQVGLISTSSSAYQQFKHIVQVLIDYMRALPVFIERSMLETMQAICSEVAILDKCFAQLGYFESCDRPYQIYLQAPVYYPSADAIALEQVLNKKKPSRLQGCIKPMGQQRPRLQSSTNLAEEGVKLLRNDKF